MAACHGAIDVGIEATAGLRRRGLGKVTGARLLRHCLQQGMEPRWLAANPESENLATKLGYTRGQTYESLEVQQEA
jgi:L-amino acid N-acyltransferase YncA